MINIFQENYFANKSTTPGSQFSKYAHQAKIMESLLKGPVNQILCLV